MDLDELDEQPSKAKSVIFIMQYLYKYELTYVRY